MFLPLFYSFLGFLEFKNLVEPIFDMRGFTRKNFSPKFWFWEKMMAAPPRSKLVQKIWGCRHVQYLSKMLKIGFVFLGNRFRVKDLLLGTVCDAYNSITEFWLFSQIFTKKCKQTHLCGEILSEHIYFSISLWISFKMRKKKSDQRYLHLKFEC